MGIWKGRRRMDLNKSISELLRETKREGIKNLIAWMEQNGFFEAPCSAQHHLCKEGGLAEHSSNVLKNMWKLANTFCPEKADDMKNSIILCALLHDIGKCGQFGKPYYIDNYLSKTDKDGNPVRSSAKPYAINPDLLNVPHDIRSLLIIREHIALTEEEQFAILYHNGLYGDLKYQITGKETQLYMLLHFADMWASRVDEIAE